MELGANGFEPISAPRLGGHRESRFRKTLRPPELCAKRQAVLRLLRHASLSLLVLIASATGARAEGTNLANVPTRPPVIFLCGDSTMSNKPLTPPHPERGWGQMFTAYFKDGVRVENLAMNGRSSKSFSDEGRWQQVRDRLQPGDFVVIQFGHNDQKQDARDRFTEPFGSFKQNLERYVREAREKGGQPILATPIARRSFLPDGKTKDTHGDYAVAVRQVATEQEVPLLDLEKRSRELLEKLGPERSKKLYLCFEPGEYASLPEGKQDNTHFNAYGASRVCDLAAEELRAHEPELAAWLMPAK